MVEVKRAENPLGLKDELVKFVFGIYRSTKGKYPALEWVEEKPSIDDFEGFKKIYEPFLEFRLTREFDELYVAQDNEIVGTVALVYNLPKEGVWWVPQEIIGPRTGLIEFLMVDERYRGKGLGSKLLEFAIKRLESLGKEAYVVTFPNLDAYNYYKRKGFEEVMKFKEFVVLRFTRRKSQ
ncbi:GNAT family N-acetyltransferase [Pyrococcus kukulkanii]|uniref:GNAT family N-acetyltransferase n=1 Tax=Pyrococcus kukulkanii TaxID=1609559 RepID=A0ABV4T6K9_9EURY